MASGDIARLYHVLTSYGPEKDYPPRAVGHPLVLKDFAANDIPTWPPQVKAYPDGLPRADLPRDWPTVDVPATAVLAGLAQAPPLTLPGPRYATCVYSWSRPPSRSCRRTLTS